MTDWLWGFCFTCGHCLFRVVNGKRPEICPRCNQAIRLSTFADLNVPRMDEEEFKRGPDVYRMFEHGHNIWSLRVLAENVKWCLRWMEDYRKQLQRDVDRYREKAPPPVNAETSFTWRKDGDLMHLTLIHPLENGTKEIEIVGTDPGAIYEARRRIEAARWLKQCEEDLADHLERDRLMRKHLEAIADMVDSLDYSDKFA